ncbi:HsmA family protein [Rummeliibacillus pycnus]|uniref:HsmA family protein n=1 Tax=Rummeliibacillus pycnus TaxID=101070 RepID=UPI003D297BE5
MDSKLLLSIITITLALIFYTWGVFSEKRTGTIKKSHILSFAFGLVFDTIGTTTMGTIAETTGGSKLGLHQIAGGAAIVLMAIHLIWAIYVVRKGTENAKHQFHKFSIIVWALWLVSYLLGAFLGITH